MKKKYKFTYKDGKEIKIEANEKFVKAHESGGCNNLEVYINCRDCPLNPNGKCPINNDTTIDLFKNTKLEEIKEMEEKTYTFIEAVNSGKRFRPASWSESTGSSSWYKWDGGLFFTETGDVNISKQHLNWQCILEEKTITISESQFDYIWSKQLTHDETKKELGF